MPVKALTLPALSPSQSPRLNRDGATQGCDVSGAGCLSSFQVSGFLLPTRRASGNAFCFRVLGSYPAIPTRPGILPANFGVRPAPLAVPYPHT
jgi:hypothetical protein